MIVSPQRDARPWNGQTDSHAPVHTAEYEPTCHLCPGNTRAGGARNPDYTSTFVFENDFAALLPDAPGAPTSTVQAGGADTGLFEIADATGECRVICFSPRHDRTLARMDLGELGSVVDLWRDQLADLAVYRWVQVFETRGEIAGSSNEHPHGQIWASDFLPDEAALELGSQQRYLAAHGTSLLVDYAAEELRLGERVIHANDDWVVVVPYWAYWPFETLVLPRRPVASMLDLQADECASLADALRTMLGAFDRLFGVPFPYCSGWHTSPNDESPGWQLHGHYYPPLLRSATVAKIPASYELLASLQRDLTPEHAAGRLRDVL